VRRKQREGAAKVGGNMKDKNDEINTEENQNFKRET
jgi:hypothetical protein